MKTSFYKNLPHKLGGDLSAAGTEGRRIPTAWMYSGELRNLGGGGDRFPRRLNAQLRPNFEKDRRGGRSGAYFLDMAGEEQEAAADCTGRGKGVFNLKVSWCSSLQTHGELISTCAIDRKEKRG